jgi:CHAT domain-containing protein/Tfp pilus assembly protein PilF
MRDWQAQRAFLACRFVLAPVCTVALLVLPAGVASQSESAESRFQAIRTLIDAGRYVEAENAAEAFVSTVRASRQASEGNDRAIDILVEALVRNGRGAEGRTRDLAEEVVNSRKATGQADHALASSLRRLGDVLVEAGDYRQAREPTERALQIDEAVLGASHPEVAVDLDHLGRVLMLIERYDEALAASTHALAINETVLDPFDVGIARSLEVRGAVLQRRGDYSAARPALERALTIRNRATAPRAEMAGTLSRLGEQARFEGNFVEAIQFSERALTLAEQTLRLDHPDIASYLRLLAIPVAAQGDLARARTLRERALAIGERALGSDHLLLAVQLNDLGTSLSAEGEYTRASALYERASKIYERALGPDNSGVATEVYNLALVNRNLGDFSAARRQFKRAISTWERVLGPDHPSVARALTEYGRMLSGQGLDREAQTLLERALAIRERTLGPNHNDVARTLTLLSAILLRLRHVQEAFDSSSRALAIWDQSTGREIRGYAEALRVHGSIQTTQHDYLAAEHSYERAVAMLRPIVGSGHPDIAEIDAPLAVALLHTGDRSDSLRYALEAEEIGRSHLRLMLRDLPERQGLEYAANRPKGLDFALSLAAASVDTERADRIFDELIRSRGTVLDEMARRRHASADAARPDLAPLWRALVSARQRYANLVIRGADEQHPERQATLVAAALRDKEDAERAFANKSAAFETELSRADVGLDDVRAAIPANSALVAFVRYDRSPIESDTPSAVSASTAVTARRAVPAYAAFVLHAGLSKPAIVPLGSAIAIEPIVTRWREQIRAAARTDAPFDAEKAYRAAGAALRRRIWDPIQEYLSDVTSVFVVPDGTLNLVSFASVPVGSTKYLIDQGPVVHYLSAERDLVAVEPYPIEAAGLLAVGGAAFDDATLFAGPKNRVPATRQTVPRAATASSLRSGCADLQSMQFSPLAGTSAEIHDISKLWTGSPAEILEGRRANEQTVKRDAPGHRVLHLATHGFFLGDCSSASTGTRSVGGLSRPGDSTKGQQPRTVVPSTLSENPLLISGLALAGANRRANAGLGDEDGILTAEEVTALNLEGVEWVVLSACDSGLGEVKAGEGVFGLRRAFQVAGARTVIMSLWSIDDLATRLWMRELYRNRLQKRLNTADAMHAASANVLRERRAAGESTHPFYWAAFVAAGDWR